MNFFFFIFILNKTKKNKNRTSKGKFNIQRNHTSTNAIWKVKHNQIEMKNENQTINNFQTNQTSRNEGRKITVPQHRMTPLKEQWMKIYTPVVEIMKLQIRMNLQNRSVELRVIFTKFNLIEKWN